MRGMEGGWDRWSRCVRVPLLRNRRPSPRWHLDLERGGTQQRRQDIRRKTQPRRRSEPPTSSAPRASPPPPSGMRSIDYLRRFKTERYATPARRARCVLGMGGCLGNVRNGRRGCGALDEPARGLAHLPRVCARTTGGPDFHRAQRALWEEVCFCFLARPHFLQPSSASLSSSRRPPTTHPRHPHVFFSLPIRPHYLALAAPTHYPPLPALPLPRRFPSLLPSSPHSSLPHPISARPPRRARPSFRPSSTRPRCLSHPPTHATYSVAHLPPLFPRPPASSTRLTALPTPFSLPVRPF
ncbi:hypothetical protein DFH09DRAFT_478212 [Mycena vulgaris]|nr:hypothetical protein DFH09DRAFT_478212 [Mycena vulgaris]